MEVTVTVKVEGCDPVEVKIPVEVNAKEDSVRSASIYARFFDAGSPQWAADSNMNLMYLKYQQTYANDLLKSRGHLFLNDVYDMLGIPRSKEGAVVGWIYDPENPDVDNYVDFDIYNEHNSEFINGYKDTVLLDFNVDGCILDKI